MSLDKAIEHGKERRKPYRGAKAIDPWCRNHGNCPWCTENRLWKFRDKQIEDMLREAETLLALQNKFDAEPPVNGWKSVEQYITAFAEFIEQEDREE